MLGYTVKFQLYCVCKGINCFSSMLLIFRSTQEFILDNGYLRQAWRFINKSIYF